jgi:3'-phosphoadenosine 5'-phosphosulfate (PAPS) 3'-phosphatase
LNSALFEGIEMTTPKAAKELLNLAGQICDLAKKAGEEILHFYRNGVAVTRKEDASPLTLADRASHDFLTESLRAIYRQWNGTLRQHSAAWRERAAASIRSMANHLLMEKTP